MRRFISYISILLVGAMYILSTMGYGVHECKHDGTKEVVLLYGESPCDIVHSHLDSEGHMYTHSHAVATCESGCGCGEENSGFEHDDSCCDTVIYTITHDQTIEDNVDVVAPSSFINFAIIPLLVSLSNPQPIYSFNGNFLDRVPIPSKGLYISNRVFRV